MAHPASSDPQPAPPATPTRWTICLLSSFRIQQSGETILRLQSRREDQLLAYLALSPRLAHDRRQLAEALWPDKDPATGTGNLAYTLFNLRKRLEPLGAPDLVVAGGRRTLQLGPGIETDVQQFSALVLAAMRLGETRQSARLLENAIALYGEGLLPGLREAWVQPERARIKEVYQEALQRLSKILSPGLGQVRIVELVTSGGPMGEMPPASAPAAAPADADIAAPAPPVNAQEAPDLLLLEGDFDRVLTFVQEVERHLTGAHKAGAMGRLDVAYPVIKRLLEHAIHQPDPEVGLRIAGPLWRYWYERGRADEGFGYLRRLLAAAPPAPTTVHAAALHAAGTLAYYAGELDAARRHLDDAAKVWLGLKDYPAAMRSIANLAMAASQDGDHLAARAAYAQCLHYARQIGDTASLLARLLNAARVEILLAEPRQAQGLLQERLRLAQDKADERAIATTLAHLATTDLALDDLPSARGHAAAALQRARALAEPRYIAFALRLLGETALREGQIEEALAHQREGVQVAQALGDVRELAESLRYLAAAMAAGGSGEEAIDLTRQALELYQSVGDTSGIRHAQQALEELTARLIP